MVFKFLNYINTLRFKKNEAYCFISKKSLRLCVKNYHKVLKGITKFTKLRFLRRFAFQSSLLIIIQKTLRALRKNLCDFARNNSVKICVICENYCPNFFFLNQKKIPPRSPKIASGVNKLNHCQFVFSSSILLLSSKRDSIFLFLSSMRLESSKSQSKQFLKNCSFP